MSPARHVLQQLFPFKGLRFFPYTHLTEMEAAPIHIPKFNCETDGGEQHLTVQAELMLSQDARAGAYVLEKGGHRILASIITMDDTVHGVHSAPETRQCAKLPVHAILTSLLDDTQGMSLAGVVVLCAVQSALVNEVSLPPPQSDRATAVCILQDIWKGILREPAVFSPRRVFIDADGDASELRAEVKWLGGSVVESRADADVVVDASATPCHTEADVAAIRSTVVARIAACAGERFLCHFWFYPASYDAWLHRTKLDNPSHTPQPSATLLTVPVTWLKHSIQHNEFMEPLDYALGETGKSLGRSVPHDWVLVARRKRKRQQEDAPQKRVKRDDGTTPATPSSTPAWFSPDFLSAFEVDALPQVDPETIVSVRNTIITAAREANTDNRYYGVHNALVDTNFDSIFVMKLHAFLECHELINVGQTLHANMARSTPTLLAPLCYVDTPTGVHPSSKVAPFTKTEELALIESLDTIFPENDQPKDINWDAIGLKVGRTGSECLLWFLEMDLEVEGGRDERVLCSPEDHSGLSPFGDSQCSVLTTLAFLSAVAPPEEVARCADTAVREVVRQSAEAAGMDVESGRLASAAVDQGKVSDAAIAALSESTARLAGYEAADLSAAAQDAALVVLKQVQASLNLVQTVNRHIAKASEDLHTLHESYTSQENTLRQNALQRQ